MAKAPDAIKLGFVAFDLERPVRTLQDSGNTNNEGA